MIVDGFVVEKGEHMCGEATYKEIDTKLIDENEVFGRKNAWSGNFYAEHEIVLVMFVNVSHNRHNTK